MRLVKGVCSGLLMKSMQTVEEFGVLPDGKKVNQYTLKNETGITVRILNYGGIIREILAPDKNGTWDNIVLAYDSLEDYIVNPPFLGAVIGRTAGRIRGGELKIGDASYPISRNSGENTLHGGYCGFHNKWMEAEFSDTDDRMILSLKFLSEDGECGYPGRLELEVAYSLMKRENRLIMAMNGIPDRKTYLNMTGHSYFNLSGKKQSIADHLLSLSADTYAKIDGEMLPQGGWTPVAESVFDLRKQQRLGNILESEDSQILCAKGFDHPFKLSSPSNEADDKACAHLQDPESGRTLKVSTSQSSMVIYTGNYLSEAQVPSSTSFCRNQGICLEAQEVPDAPGNSAFECSYLEAGQVYSHYIEYAFSAE